MWFYKFYHSQHQRLGRLGLWQRWGVGHFPGVGLQGGGERPTIQVLEADSNPATPRGVETEAEERSLPSCLLHRRNGLKVWWEGGKQSKGLVYRGGTERTFLIPPLHQEAKPKTLPRDFCGMAPTGKSSGHTLLDWLSL